MNKTLKIILIILNLIMFGIAILWFFENKEKEPIIVSIGQFATLLILIFEKQASKIFSKNIESSKIKIKNRNGADVHSEKIRDSEIDIS